jgi:hypothetical protein
VLPHRRPRSCDFREWAERTAGETGEPRGWQAIRTLLQVARDRVTLIGWGGDIVRPIYWKAMRVDSPVTASHILAICRVEPLPEFVARAESWLKSVPTRNPITIMDLLLAEQRGGCWTGVVQYPEDGYSLRRLNPMCHQEIVRTLMCLPEAYRREVVFERDLIAAQWPELLNFPFNEQVPTGRVRDVYYRTKQSVGSRVARVRRVMRIARVDPAWGRRKLWHRLRGRAASR